MLSRSSMAHALGVLAALMAGCFDFGEPGADAAVGATPDATVAADASATCTEGPAPTDTPGIEVQIISFALDRPSVTVPAGSVVIWRNADTMPHQLVSGAPGAPISPAEGGFDSGELAPGQAYAHRFCRARSLVYFCATHPGGMKGYRLEVP